MSGQNQFLCALAPELFETLKPHLRAREYVAGDVLFRAQDRIASVHFLRAGAVSLVLELSGGQMIESAMVGRDSLVGGGAALDHREAVHKAIVQVTGSGHAMAIDAIRQIANESHELRTAIVRHEQLILAQAQQSAACNATHNLPERRAVAAEGS